MAIRLFRVREGNGINYPEPGHVPPEGKRADPKHEIRAEGGAVVDLSHLRPMAIDFYLANQVVDELPPDSEELPTLIALDARDTPEALVAFVVPRGGQEG